MGVWHLFPQSSGCGAACVEEGAQVAYLSARQPGSSHTLLDLSSEALVSGFWLWVPGGP